MKNTAAATLQHNVSLKRAKWIVDEDCSTSTASLFHSLTRPRSHTHTRSGEREREREREKERLPPSIRLPANRSGSGRKEGRSTRTKARGATRPPPPTAEKRPPRPRPRPRRSCFNVLCMCVCLRVCVKTKQEGTASKNVRASFFLSFFLSLSEGEKREKMKEWKKESWRLLSSSSAVAPLVGIRGL